MLLRDTQPGDRIVLVGTVQGPDDTDALGGPVVVEFDDGSIQSAWSLGEATPCRLLDELEVKQVIA